MRLSEVASFGTGKVLIGIIIILSGALIALGFHDLSVSGERNVLEQKIKTAEVEKINDELQKEALRSSILIQNEAVEKQRIDAEKRAIYFEQASKRIQSKYEVTKAEVQNLSGDAECKAIRSIVREAVK